MHRSNTKTVLGLLGLARPLGGYMALAVTFGVIESIAAILIPVFGGYAFLGATGLGGGGQLSTLIALVLICAAVRGGLRYAEQYFNHFIAFKLLALIRDRVFSALRRLAPAKLEGKDKGNLISMITADVELIEVFYAHTISPVLIAVITSAIMCIFFAQLHIVFLLLALAAYLVIGLVIPLLSSRKSSAAGREFRDGAGDLSSFVLDSLRGIEQTIQYDDGAARMRVLREKTAGLADKQAVMKDCEAKTIGLVNAVVIAFTALMLTAGVLLHGEGAVSVTSVVIALIALMSSFGPVIALSNLPGNLTHTFACANRVFDLLDEVPAVQEVMAEDGCSVAFDGMACDRVSFSYGGEDILANFSITIPENHIIGITGKSGSGKSTLLKLLMRFWDADSGRVLISGCDVRDVSTKNLRDAQSYMTQDTHIFNGTLRENILLAGPDASAEDVEAACRKASIHDFIAALPDGYDTPACELGERLSGGEKQRIGLARVFLHASPLILLDEPTSNLDSLNEAVILRSLYESRADKTVVLVSHRKSTMRIADAVFTAERNLKS
jgi:ATP-binding cassette subfamily C protein